MRQYRFSISQLGQYAELPPSFSCLSGGSAFLSRTTLEYRRALMARHLRVSTFSSGFPLDIRRSSSRYIPLGITGPSVPSFPFLRHEVSTPRRRRRCLKFAISFSLARPIPNFRPRKTLPSLTLSRHWLRLFPMAPVIDAGTAVSVGRADGHFATQHRRIHKPPVVISYMP